jgi:hypothetical protein
MMAPHAWAAPRKRETPMTPRAKFLAAAVGALSTLGAAGAAHASFLFKDAFKPPSSQWDNASGNWTAVKGKYFAQQPNNNPEALTSLPFVFPNTGDSFVVKINNLGDGGLIFKSSTSSDYVLLVVGGAGYGQGVRGGNAGVSAYWADAANPSAAFNDNTSAFTPGQTYVVKVTDTKGVFKAFEKVGTTFTQITSFSYPTLTSFTFGLYDDQPNTTTGSGSGPAQSFSSLTLKSTGAVTTAAIAAVPEPATWATMLIGLGMIGALARSNRRKGVMA